MGSLIITVLGQVDGQIRLPSGPGLGWVLDEERIQPYRVEQD
jgi:hypothetical protein